MILGLNYFLYSNMEFLLQLDSDLFYLINKGLDSALLDLILIPFRNKYTWIPLYLFFIGYILFKRKSIHPISIVFLVLTVTIADQLSSSVLKKMMERPRPCHVEAQLKDNLTKVRCGKGYSWPSSHATNHFAIAIFLVLLFGATAWYIKFLLILWASMISFAQVYVGVHFPIDVISGALIGTLLGITMFTLYRFFINQVITKKVRV